MKRNEVKCFFQFADHKHEMLFATIVKAKIWESKQQKRFGFLIKRDLKFDEHVFLQYRKADENRSALIRISKLMYKGEICKLLLATCLDVLRETNLGTYK